MLNVNTEAPDFTLCDENGVKHSLSDYRGKRVILYFYPKDNTSGCTAQACLYSTELPHFMEKGVEVIGISKDSVKSHLNFKNKYDLKFTLLSDESLEVIKAYDVYKEKNMYGKKVMGVLRTTYLIDEEGMIIYACDKAKAKEDATKMLEIIS